MTIKSSIDEFYTGTTIYHKKYGSGRIKSLNGNIADIEFEKRIFSRKIDLKYCIEKGIIYIENDETNQ